MIVVLEPGQKVRTLADTGPSGYIPGARDGCRWGQEGTVVQRTTGHGCCYEVRVDGVTGWYEPEELEYWHIMRGYTLMVEPPAEPLTAWERLEKDDFP